MNWQSLRLSVGEGQATALNLTQHGRQQKNLKPQPSGGMSPGSMLPATYNTPLALTTSKSGESMLYLSQ